MLCRRTLWRLVGYFVCVRSEKCLFCFATFERTNRKKIRPNKYRSKVLNESRNFGIICAAGETGAYFFGEKNFFFVIFTLSFDKIAKKHMQEEIEFLPFFICCLSSRSPVVRLDIDWQNLCCVVSFLFFKLIPIVNWVFSFTLSLSTS